MKAYLHTVCQIRLYGFLNMYLARRRYDWFLERRGNDFKPCPQPHMAFLAVLYVSYWHP